MSPLKLRMEVLSDVNQERNRQDGKWGKQRHDHFKWLAIIGEEYGEVCQAMQKEIGWGKESDSDDVYTELIQLAAVCVSTAEQIREERAKHELRK